MARACPILLHFAYSVAGLTISEQNLGSANRGRHTHFRRNFGYDKSIINKASADSMYSLARALGCTMEDLIER